MKNYTLLSFAAIVVAVPKPGFGQPARTNTNSVVNGTACVNEVESVPQAGIRTHISEDQEPVYSSNPPVTGEHYARWARWGIYTETLPRGFWVHNLEHGGVIFVYRPDADPALIEALLRVYDAIPDDPECGHRRTIVTPDPLLDAPWRTATRRTKTSATTGMLLRYSQFPPERDKYLAPDDTRG